MLRRAEPRIALVHDWLTGMRGGEKCLEVLCDLYPEADIYTLFHFPGTVSEQIERHPIRESFLRRFPALRSGYRRYLPLFPVAIEQFDFSGYDLVVSVSHCVAKGALTAPGTPHLCYCLTPMRYIWDMAPAYFGPGRLRAPARWLVPPLLSLLRAWDSASSTRVDSYIAISEHVDRRIRKFYGRSAEQVIYPPVDTSFFTPGVGEEAEDYYLIVSALVPYKKIEIALEVFRATGDRLLIIGSGPDEKRLRRLAPHNVRFLGWLPEEGLLRALRRCRAFVFPGEEDFGIAPVEAQAAGRPVIAYGRGGALETVVPADSEQPGAAPTGIFFHEQTAEALADAVAAFREQERCFEPKAIRDHALRFDVSVYRKRIGEAVERMIQEKC